MVWQKGISPFKFFFKSSFIKRKQKFVWDWVHHRWIYSVVSKSNVRKKNYLSTFQLISNSFVNGWGHRDHDHKRIVIQWSPVQLKQKFYSSDLILSF